MNRMNQKILNLKKSRLHTLNQQLKQEFVAYLIDRAADSVNEADLHLGQLVLLVPVHHWLKPTKSPLEEFCPSRAKTNRITTRRVLSISG